MANAEIVRDIQSGVISRGYEAPLICTPEEMLGDWQ